jgi:hypothetical protein
MMSLLFAFGACMLSKIGADEMGFQINVAVVMNEFASALYELTLVQLGAFCEVGFMSADLQNAVRSVELLEDQIEAE